MGKNLQYNDKSAPQENDNFLNIGNNCNKFALNNIKYHL